MNDVVSALELLTPFDMDAEKTRIGGDGDGGYVLADIIAPGSDVMSYGVGEDISFDRAMAARGHRVLMFDHTVEPPSGLSDRLMFTREGVGPTDDPAKNLRSLASHVAAFDVAGADAILKMDVEGAEFAVLPSASQETLGRFSQILLEIHGLNKLGDAAFRARFMATFEAVNQQFALVHVHANNWDGAGSVFIDGLPVPEVLELSYVRRDLVSLRPSQTLYPTEFDRPNVPKPQKLLWHYPFLPTTQSPDAFRACFARVQAHDGELPKPRKPSRLVRTMNKRLRKTFGVEIHRKSG